MRLHASVALLLAALPLAASAQDAVPTEGAGGSVPPAVRVPGTFGPDGGFPFDLRTDDVAETFVDLSWMNDGPADRAITVRNGHYAFADTGERVRFWGTNVGAANAFPTREAADLLAKRLAKLGCNVVRLHHLDNEWMRGEGGGTLWPATGAHRRFVPGELNKLDYLVFALNREGIYVNLNLKVSKELSDADGMPPGWDEIPFVHQKRVDRFFPLLVEHQKWYAGELLTHVNPYTGTTAIDNPGVAFLEVNNENSVMHLWPGQKVGAGLDQLPGPYLAELQKQWNAWLADRHGDDEALRAAWSVGADPDAGEPVTTPSALAANGLFGAAVSVEPGERNVIHVTETTGTDWHAQVLLGDLTLEESAGYTLSFTASADAERTVRLSADCSAGDYGNLGLDETLTLTREPQAFRLPFRAAGTLGPGQSRIAFNVGAETGGVVVSDLRLVRGFELPPIEGSLADASYAVPSRTTPGQEADWLAFLADTERRHSDAMRSLLRDELGVTKPIADSQLQWGGASALHREHPGDGAGSDFVDTHAYWQHPDFAGGDWNPEDWTIGNASLVSALARGESGPLGLASFRVAGVPFGVSEVDQPAPSDWAAELVPVVATFAAAQDWDALYTFESGAHADPDAPLANYFSHLKHTAKAGQSPAAALVFRQGLIPPIEATATLHAPTPLHPAALTLERAWNLAGAGLDAGGRLAHRVSVAPGDADRPAAEVEPGASPLRIRPDHGGLYTATGDRAAVAVGFLGTDPIRLGPVTLTATDGPTRFGSVSLLPTDGRPLTESASLLLTVVGRAQNTGMGWNAARTSVGTDWGTTPMLVQTPTLTIELPRPGLRAWSLDPTGARKTELPVEGRTLRVSPADETIWYELRAE